MNQSMIHNPHMIVAGNRLTGKRNRWAGQLTVTLASSALGVGRNHLSQVLNGHRHSKRLMRRLRNEFPKLYKAYEAKFTVFKP